jgi:acetyltransferase-like isoleucine patch superfamily enzyme
MGYDKDFSKKALFNTGNDISKAIDYIKKGIHEEVEIKKLVDKNCCTFNFSKNNYAFQKWVICRTCAIKEGTGCCMSCANNCHKGHDLSEIKIGPFFCDCGSGDLKEKCKILN